MASRFSYELCNTEFWNNNITWNTNSPQFSPCFRDTVLVWLPASIILIVILSENYNIRNARSRKFQQIPWNIFNSMRMLVTLFIFLLKLLEFIGYNYTIITDISPLESTNLDLGVLVFSSYVAPIIQFLSYLILLTIYYAHRRAGIFTSASIWFFLFLSVLSGAIEYYAITVSAESAVFNQLELYVKLIHYPALVLLFLLECWGDKPNIKSTLSLDYRPDPPELTVSFFSSIMFWWFQKFLIFGYRTKLNLNTLWKTMPRDQAGEVVPKFEQKWNKNKGKSKSQVYRLTDGRAQQANNISMVLLRLFFGKLLFAASLKFLQDILQYLSPLVLKKILLFMNSDEPEWHGVLFALLLLILPTIQSIVLGNYFYYMQVIGLQVRTMIIGAVYRKALLLSGSSRLQSTSGEIVNLMAVDSHRYQDLLIYLNLFWSAPLQIIISIVLLYQELGWPVFAGVICMALMLPANAYLANRVKFSQVKLMKTKDHRIKQMNEVLGGIKVIKLYAWENSFISNLFGFRTQEIKYLNRILTLDALQTFLWQCSPFVVALVTFAVYVNADPSNVLDAEKAFVSISLFNLLRFPLSMLPNLVSSIVLTMVSAKRLNKFLNSDELIRYVTRNQELEAISVEGATVSWFANDEKQVDDKLAKAAAVLRDVDLHIKPKSFVAIVGQVGSGKSSLLASILGEMHRISGRFNVCANMNIAYVPQQAWIQNMTVKENVLFGSRFDERKYQQVLSVCALRQDLETLPGGDGAEIGEKGINLSGGQKQRVSLARACYSQSDIYLLDDPLSALDSHVAKHVFDEVLSSSSGLLKDKTRVLATNSLFVLPYVDQIVVLDNGRVVESGSYKELMSIAGGYLNGWMRQHSGNQDLTTDLALTSQTVDIDKAPLIGEKTLKSVAPATDSSRLIEVEKMETGSVNYSVYLIYFKAISILWLSLVILSTVAAAGFNVGTNMWLSVWSSDSEDPEKVNDPDLRTLRLVIYAVLGGLQSFTVLTGSLALSRGAVRAARRLHIFLLERVMHSPMSFFDTTPMGRIVNRFAKDIDVVDSVLPGTVRSWINCFLNVASTIFVICYSFPTLLLVVIPLIFIYYLIQKVFIVTTRQLKRLESTTRSPIYSHFSETLSGIGTIRAYSNVDRFVKLSDDLVDRNQSCSYPNVIANRWLSIRLEFFGNLITACVALYSIYYRGSIIAGLAGLTISFSMSITQTLSWLVRMTSDLETHIVSVERISEYTNNEQEDNWIKETRPDPDWPNEGSIQIEDYSTRYRVDTCLVLKNLTISVKAKEKIGIVGRTGSGKSSLSLALFRVLEPASGSISIDRMKLSDCGLHDLRSKLTIIPQDPVLFSGTLRFNLDPLNLYSDEEIWRSLELAHLSAYITSLNTGLDYQVSEYGENFSVGQRQLICLARAILRKSKILVLDEATASVDLETDSIVQRTIRDLFADCTIITIAHRLHTILDSDRILVLDQGRVVELASPAELAADANSEFSALVRDAGIEPSSIVALAEEKSKQE